MAAAPKRTRPTRGSVRPSGPQDVLAAAGPYGSVAGCSAAAVPITDPTSAIAVPPDEVYGFGAERVIEAVEERVRVLAPLGSKGIHPTSSMTMRRLRASRSDSSVSRPLVFASEMRVTT